MLDEAAHMLRRWLAGQLISMSAIGVVIYIGLLTLGMPLALVLALFAGVAGFIPYIGPIIGAIPMLLVAGGVSLDMLLWVFGLYALVQAMESHLLTPLIQSRAVDMPPAAVIVAQLVFGALFGVLGLALATPVVAVAMVPLRDVFPERTARERA